MTDGPLDPAAAARIAEAEHQGFLRGLNVAFVCIGTLAVAAVCWRLLIEAPKFEEVFRQVKVPIPGLTLLVLQTRVPAAVLFMLLAGSCIWATKCHGEKRFTLVINALLFGGALFWLFVVTMGLHLPFVHMMGGLGHGIGPRD